VKQLSNLNLKLGIKQINGKQNSEQRKEWLPTTGLNSKSLAGEQHRRLYTCIEYLFNLQKAALRTTTSADRHHVKYTLYIL
jgi:hypothetical protein